MTGDSGAFEWHYLEAGTVTHARQRRSGGLDYAARCGTAPVWWKDSSAWHGTGTQDEYERAAALPRCKRCVALTGERKPCYCHPGCSACAVNEPCPHGQVPR